MSTYEPFPIWEYGRSGGYGEYSNLGALPSGGTWLYEGNTYTFVIRLTGRISKPSNNTLLLNLRNNVDKTRIGTTLSVTSAFGSGDYNLVIRIDRTVSYTQLMNIIKNGVKFDLGFNVGEIDFFGEAIQARGTIESVANVGERITGITSNLKWIAIAVVGVIGLWAVLPALRGASKRIG